MLQLPLRHLDMYNTLSGKFEIRNKHGAVMGQNILVIGSRNNENQATMKSTGQSYGPNITVLQRQGICVKINKKYIDNQIFIDLLLGGRINS